MVEILDRIPERVYGGARVDLCWIAANLSLTLTCRAFDKLVQQDMENEKEVTKLVLSSLSWPDWSIKESIEIAVMTSMFFFSYLPRRNHYSIRQVISSSILDSIPFLLISPSTYWCLSCFIILIWSFPPFTSLLASKFPAEREQVECH